MRFPNAIPRFGPPHIGKHEILETDRLDRPGRVEIGPSLRMKKVLCRSVWLASMTCWSDGRPAGSRRGPVSR